MCVLQHLWNCLRNIKYDEHQIEIYFMRFMRKIKICYISNFVNLKYLIHETILTLLIGLLAHSLMLIIFKYPRPWR